MNHELVIEGKTYVNHSFQQCNIGVDNGKITAIKKILKGDKHRKFSKELLIPAGIDVHVHFRDPGMIHKETFYSGSLAAVFGGISCVFDMPNTSPACINQKRLIEKQRIAKRKSVADFGIYAGISQENIEDDEMISQLSSLCHGFKIYLGDTTNSLNLSKEYLTKALSLLKEKDTLVLIHAEDQECLQKYRKNEHNPSDHDSARPSLCEHESIELILSIAKKINTPVHICHVSSPTSIKKLNERSKNVSYGITPHHSLLHYSMNHVSKNWLKVNPPLRSKTDQESIFETVRMGDVYLLESDHAPHTDSEKEKDFSDAPCGIPGVETLFPLYLALAGKKQISFERIIQLICEHPSRLLNISKGFISRGFDADIIAIDKKNIHKLNNEYLHSSCKCSPFENFPVLFPSSTFIRGHEVVKDNEIQVSEGFGELISQNNKE